MIVPMVEGYKVLWYIHNKHDKERIGLANCQCVIDGEIN